jgi:hypothetical protein
MLASTSRDSECAVVTGLRYRFLPLYARRGSRAPPRVVHVDALCEVQARGTAQENLRHMCSACRVRPDGAPSLSALYSHPLAML